MLKSYYWEKLTFSKLRFSIFKKIVTKSVFGELSDHLLPTTLSVFYFVNVINPLYGPWPSKVSDLPTALKISWVVILLQAKYRSSHQRFSVKKGVFRNFIKFIGFVWKWSVFNLSTFKTVFQFFEKGFRFPENLFQKLNYRKRSKFPQIVTQKHADISNGGIFLKSLVQFFRKTYAISAAFKMKPQKRNFFQY